MERFYLPEYRAFLVSLYYANIEIAMMLLALVCAVASIGLAYYFTCRFLYRWTKRKHTPVERERIKRMHQAARDAYVRRIASDAITEALERIEYEGFITRREKQKLYKQIGERCNMPDLLPRRLFESIKARAYRLSILKQMISARLSPSTVTPLPIPGAKIEEVPAKKKLRLVAA